MAEATTAVASFVAGVGAVLAVLRWREEHGRPQVGAQILRWKEPNGTYRLILRIGFYAPARRVQLFRVLLSVPKLYTSDLSNDADLKLPRWFEPHEGVDKDIGIREIADTFAPVLAELQAKRTELRRLSAYFVTGDGRTRWAKLTRHDQKILLGWLAEWPARGEPPRRSSP